MAQSGWYDDPDGTPGRLRYWDGTQWTHNTMAKPSATPAPDQTSVLPPAVGPNQTAVLPPVRPAPQTGFPGSYGPQATGQPAAPGTGYGPYVPGPPYPSGASTYGSVPPKSPRKGLRATAVLGVLALLVGLGFGVNALTKSNTTATPTTTTSKAPASMPSTFPTVTMPTVTVPGKTVAPTIPDSSPDAGGCPAPAKGDLTDGVITVTMPSTWAEDLDTDISWADCFTLGGRTVTKGWQTSALVATVPADGSTTEQTAADVWAWNVKSNYGSGNSVTSATVAKSEAVTIGTHKGFKVTGQVKIKGLAGVTGDDVAILVLDNPDKTQSILLTAATIDDAASTADVAAIWASLKVK